MQWTWKLETWTLHANNNKNVSTGEFVLSCFVTTCLSWQWHLGWEFRWLVACCLTHVVEILIGIIVQFPHYRPCTRPKQQTYRPTHDISWPHLLKIKLNDWYILFYCVNWPLLIETSCVLCSIFGDNGEGRGVGHRLVMELQFGGRAKLLLCPACSDNVNPG